MNLIFLLTLIKIYPDVQYRGEVITGLGEYVNTSTNGERTVERTDNLLCIGSDGGGNLMELIGLGGHLCGNEAELVPTHEIWDALDEWLSASAGK